MLLWLILRFTLRNAITDVTSHVCWYGPPRVPRKIMPTELEGDMTRSALWISSDGSWHQWWSIVREVERKLNGKASLKQTEEFQCYLNVTRMSSPGQERCNWFHITIARAASFMCTFNLPAKALSALVAPQVTPCDALHSSQVHNARITLVQDLPRTGSLRPTHPPF